MAQRPRKINIYQDKGFLLELDAVQKGKDGRGLSTSSGRQTNKPYPSEKSPNKDGVQQQSSIDEDKSKERFVFQTKLINFIIHRYINVIYKYMIIIQCNLVWHLLVRKINLKLSGPGIQQ